MNSNRLDRSTDSIQSSTDERKNANQNLEIWIDFPVKVAKGPWKLGYFTGIK